MKVYIARHGQTQFNVERRIQGWMDSPLTDLGVKQAHKLGNYLKDIDFKIAYSSDVLRALNTLKIALEGRNIEIIESDQLRELSFGSMEGKPYLDEMDKRFYIGLEEFGGETNEKVGKRVSDFIKDKYRLYPDDSILIVSHGWAIRSFLRTIDQKRLDEFFDINPRTKNCSISIVDYDGDKFEIEEIFKNILDS